MRLLIDCAVAAEVGLFDERYFIGKEDGDFTHRVRLAGYRIVEPPRARVRHRSRRRGSWLFYYQIRNRWHVILKNYEVRTILVLLPAFVLHEALQAIVLTAKDTPSPTSERGPACAACFPHWPPTGRESSASGFVPTGSC